MSGKIAGNTVRVSFMLPSPPLTPFITTYYLIDFNVAEGETVQDWLHPEWANLRVSDRGGLQAAFGSEPLTSVSGVITTGPTSRAAHFSSGPARVWGIGILPVGWARFFDDSAATYADRFFDAATQPACADIAGLRDTIFAGEPDPAGEAARIDAHFLALLGRRPPNPDEARIRQAHAALIDDDVASVAEFAERMQMSSRTLERLCLRAFGYPPKLLLRRQRFLRSLAQFMLDPSLAWIRTLDSHYVDQAHFVRDFKRFMGMSPSAYGALDHPVLRAAAQARTAAAGAAVQALHRP